MSLRNNLREPFVFVNSLFDLLEKNKWVSKEKNDRGEHALGKVGSHDVTDQNIAFAH